MTCTHLIFFVVTIISITKKFILLIIGKDNSFNMEVKIKIPYLTAFNSENKV